MKTTVLVISLVMASFCTLATIPGSDFVVADGKLIYCTHLKKGFSNTQITSVDGMSYKIPNASLQSFRQNGRQYHLLPLIDRNGDTAAAAFMELIAVRDGCCLFRYCSNCSKYDPLSTDIAPANYIYRYYVVKNGNIKLLSDENTLRLTMHYFNVKIIC